MPATISLFPVDNGDMTLITLDTGRKILIDCNIRQAADNDEDDILDVAEELKDRLERDDQDRMFVDVMLLSHPDKDHCSGLKTHFHLGAPDDWNEGDDKILINEMWSSPMVFRRASKRLTLSADAKGWATEARRRVKLHRDDDKYDANPGNRIKILGEDEDGKTDGLDDILYVIDDLISEADGIDDGSFDARLLGPLPISDDEDEEEALSKNRSSVILRFSLTADGIKDKGRFLTGGDAEVDVWGRLWRKHNADNKDWLSFDILLSPHHCSWHSLSYDSWSDLGEKAEIDDDARNALAQTETGAVIVASSKEIKSNDSDPPSERAKREYVEIVDSDVDRFYCTADDPNDVLEFEITATGPQKRRKTLKSAATLLGVGATSRAARDHGK